MMAARKNTQTNTPTPDAIRAETLALVASVASVEKAGKSAVQAATLDSFTDNADALVKLGAHCVNVLAPMVTGALTGENVAKLFAKDGALYPTDTDERDALKSATVYTRALRVQRFDSAETRALFLNGPAALVKRCAALAGVDGHTPGITSYYEWLGVMNADTIAVTKALPADFLAKFNIFTDDQTGATVYAKRKPAVGTDDSASVKFKRDSAPVLALVLDAKRDALTKMVADSTFDIDIPAERLPALVEYVTARYMLSLSTPAETPVTPGKVKLSLV